MLDRCFQAGIDPGEQIHRQLIGCCEGLVILSQNVEQHAEIMQNRAGVIFINGEIFEYLFAFVCELHFFDKLLVHTVPPYLFHDAIMVQSERAEYPESSSFVKFSPVLKTKKLIFHTG